MKLTEIYFFVGKVNAVKCKILVAYYACVVKSGTQLRLCSDE